MTPRVLVNTRIFFLIPYERKNNATIMGIVGFFGPKMWSDEKEPKKQKKVMFANLKIKIPKRNWLGIGFINV